MTKMPESLVEFRLTVSEENIVIVDSGKLFGMNIHHDSSFFSIIHDDSSLCMIIH